MKKIFIKIVLSVFSLFSIIFSIVTIFQSVQNISYYQDIKGNAYWLLMSKDSVEFALGFETYRLIFWIVCCISNLLFFLVVNFKGLQFVTISATQLIKEHNSKENKRAKLSQEIAKKQAELDELNNESKTE